MKYTKFGLLLMLALAAWPLMAQTAWYDNAQARIDTLRKGNFTVTVKTPEGVSLTDSVRVVMKKHEFAWGYAADLNSGSGSDWLKSIMLRYCNYGVNTNSFKWSGIQAYAGEPNYTNFDNTIAWFQELGWGFRAHTLLWGGTSVTDYHCVPQWVMEQRTDPIVMTATCSTRVAREVTRYKGIVKEYDVMNEASNGHAAFLQSIVGESINWNCFKWAHAADPTAKLFLNDYNIIEYGSQTDNFVSLVRRIIDNNGPISGIGTQSHIGRTVDLAGFKTQLDKLAQFNIPLKVTEFDMNYGDGTVMTPDLERQYADEMGKMLRLCFSYPAMNGFIFWGMTGAWAKGVMNPYRDDKTFRIAADTIYNLIKKQWSTDVKGTLNENGSYTFNGYYGEYDVQVKVNGVWKKFNVSCTKANKGKTFDLSTAGVSNISPTLQEVTIVEPNQIHLRFDKAMSNPASKVSYFRVFDSKTNSITAASLKSGDSKTVILTLNSSIGKRDYIPVAHLGYSAMPYTSADGAKLEPFGNELTSNVSFSSIGFVASSSENGRYIKASFPVDLLASSVVASEYVVTVNGTVAPLLSASVGTDKKVVLLELANSLTKGTEVVTVRYANGSLKRLDGRYFATFKSIATTVTATNTVVPPALGSVYTATSGTSITLKFNVDMTSPSGLDSCFTLTSSKNVPYKVTAASSSPWSKKNMTLTVSTPVVKDDVVSLTYTGNALSSSVGVRLDNFTSTVTNNSTTALTEVNDKSVTVLPNPFRDQLVVNHNGTYKTLVITDLEGRVKWQQSIMSNMSETIPTSTWEQGVYILMLSDGKKSTNLKVVKK